MNNMYRLVVYKLIEDFGQYQKIEVKFFLRLLIELSKEIIKNFRHRDFCLQYISNGIAIIKRIDYYLI